MNTEPDRKSHGNDDPVDTTLSKDQALFAEAFERHRRELHVHCYRMLGSLSESEDLVQETFLRAWSKLASYAGRASFRSWLYGIATNACLDLLRQRRRRRVLPFDVVPAIGPEGPSAPPDDSDWLEPYPGQLLDDLEPDDAVIARETIELAFLAAIHHVPARQRAVLILRDVLELSARETATALEMSEVAVKSALQRARSTLRERLPARREEWRAATDVTAPDRAVVRRYVEAHQNDDIDGLVDVLREDVRVAYPQLAMWCDSRDLFIKGSREHALPGDYRFVPTSANLQPAVAIYVRTPGDTHFRIVALEVLRIEDGQVAEIVDFDLPDLYPAFGLAATLP